jgi:hypothetical protein
VRAFRHTVSSDVYDCLVVRAYSPRPLRNIHFNISLTFLGLVPRWKVIISLSFLFPFFSLLVLISFSSTLTWLLVLGTVLFHLWLYILTVHIVSAA